MNNEDKAARHLAAIQAELVELFGDFCRRAPAPGVASLMQQFQEHRLSLVFTVTTSMDETGLFCGFVAAGSGPSDMQALFTAHAPIGNPAARGLH